MAGKQWYVHMDGETLGPLSTEAVNKMLKQARLHYVDFVWCDDFTKWHRVSDVDEFVGEMPPYPKVPIPSSKKAKIKEPEEAQEKEEASEPEPEPVIEKPAPEPKKKAEKKPEPPPKPAKKVWPKSRKHIRIPITGAIKTPDKEYTVVNIGEGGLFVKAKEILEVGTELKYTFTSKSFEKPMEMTGIVIRQGQSDSQDGFAISFTRLNPAYKRVIQEFIDDNYKE